MDAAPTVRLNDGEVRGTWSDGIAGFRGIPYATAERFAPPVPGDAVGRSRCHRVRSDRAPGRRARSSSAPTSSRTSSASRSTCGPRPPTMRRRPIMVWIHGGAFRTGSGASPLYEGTTLAARGDVVVITINYRLGLLGFLGHPDLAADAGEPLRELGPARLRRGPAMGAGARCGVRRRPERRDDLRRVGRRRRRVAPVRHADRHEACSTRRWCRAVRRSRRRMDACRRAGRASGRARRRVERGRAARPAASTQILAVQQQVEADGADRTFVPAVDGTRRPDPAGPRAPRRVRGRGPAC